MTLALIEIIFNTLYTDNDLYELVINSEVICVIYTDNADSCTLRTVSFYNENSVITGNNRGQMKIWDFRTALNNCENSFKPSGSPVMNYYFLNVTKE